MDVRHEVIRAAAERASALARSDGDALRRLLHEDFRWTSHRGETFERDEYIRRNTTGAIRWQSQGLSGVVVTVVGGTAVLLAEVTDVIGTEEDHETFQMPMTQTWVRYDGEWRCLAGHAGPRRQGE